MKMRDVCRIALHNLWYNKSRTLFTVVIITIVSALIMTISLLGISFFKNYENVNALRLQGGVSYTLNGRTGGAIKGFTMEDFAAVNAVTEKYGGIIDRKYLQMEVMTIYYGFSEDISEEEFGARLSEGGCKSVYTDYTGGDSIAADFNMYDFTGREPVVGGRKWESSDAGAARVWLSERYLEKFADDGVNIGIGDKIALAEKNSAESAKILEITGIIDPEQTSIDEDFAYEWPVGFIVDYTWFLNEFGSAATSADGFGNKNMLFGYTPPAGFNYRALYRDMKKFVKEMNSEIEPNVLDGKAEARFGCQYLESVKTTNLIRGIVLGAMSMLAFFVLLLSVGSVANSIFISVDKSRKFIGLMKAMGLEQRGVVRIILCESLFMVMLGVLFGFGILFAVRPAVISLESAVISAIYRGMEYAVTVSVPAYLPIVTAAVFFLFTWLFSRGSLADIAKQDVIATITEAA